MAQVAYLDVFIVLDKLLVIVGDMELVGVWVGLVGLEKGLDGLGAVLVVHARVELFLVILLLRSRLGRGGGGLRSLFLCNLAGLLALLELVLGDLTQVQSVST